MEPEKQSVEIGEIVEGKIEGTGEKGDKIIKKQGLVIFVKSEKKEGEFLKAKITKVLTKLAFGEEIKDDI